MVSALSVVMPTNREMNEFRRILKNAHRTGWKSDRYLEGWGDAVDYLETAFEKIYGVVDFEEWV